MKKELVFISAIFFVAVIISGCSKGGEITGEMEKGIEARCAVLNTPEAPVDENR
ncbi:hypothetical protein KAU39_02335 [bacterium]|nr:hypothetical protein [bacterium]